jgi:hypothetical protein
MSSKARAKAQPVGRSRAKPATAGKGEYYHIEVRPKKDFTTFRTQDVGEKGGIQRVAGKRSSGDWDTQKWLISKNEAHLEGDKLIPDTKEAREVLKDLGSKPVHIRGDRFKAERWWMSGSGAQRAEARPMLVLRNKLRVGLCALAYRSLSQRTARR